MDVARWLRGLGLQQYAPALRERDMDGEVLRWLKTEDLRELGAAAIRHRRCLLDPIAALGDGKQPTEVRRRRVPPPRPSGAS
jgi:hypothetical protein